MVRTDCSTGAAETAETESTWAHANPVLGKGLGFVGHILTTAHG